MGIRNSIWFSIAAYDSRGPGSASSICSWIKRMSVDSFGIEHDRRAALAHAHEAQIFEPVDRLAHDQRRDIELFGEIALRREGLVRFQLTFEDRTRERIEDVVGHALPHGWRTPERRDRMRRIGLGKTRGSHVPYSLSLLGQPVRYSVNDCTDHICLPDPTKFPILL